MKEIILLKTILSEASKMGQNGLTVTELSERANLHRNTIAKIMKVLQLKGDVDVRHVGAAKIFSLTQRIPLSCFHNFYEIALIAFNSRMKAEYFSTKINGLFQINDCKYYGKELIEFPFEIFQDPDLLKNIYPALNGKKYSKYIPTVINGHKFYILTIVIPIVFDDGKSGFALIFIDKSKEKETVFSLKTSESRYQTIVEDQTELIFRCLPDKTLTFVNDAYSSYLGKRREELIGFESPFAIMEDNKNLVNKVISDISLSEPVKTVDCKVIDSNGSLRWQRWSIQGIFDENGILNEYQNVGRDITDLKHAEDKMRMYRDNLEIMVEQRTQELQQTNRNLMKEIVERKKAEKCLLLSLEEIQGTDEAIRQVEEKSDILFDNVSDAIYFHGFTENGKPDRFIKVNDVFCERLQYTRDELNNMTVFDIYSPDVRDKLNFWNEKAFFDSIFSFESYHIRKDGTKIPVEVNSHTLKLNGKNVRLSLARVNGGNGGEYCRPDKDWKKFSDCMELLSLAVFETDDSGDLVYLNQNAYDIFGYLEEDLFCGINIADIFVPEQKPYIKYAIGLCLNGESGGGKMYLAQAKDGRTFPVLLYYGPIVYNDKIVGSRGILIDLKDKNYESPDKSYWQ